MANHELNYWQQRAFDYIKKHPDCLALDVSAGCSRTVTGILNQAISDLVSLGYVQGSAEQPIRYSVK